jgi:predicted GH43/DUF377 family glycosyl hydrolase
MDFSLLLHIVAALFSFFITGAILGATFSKPIRKKISTLVKSFKNPILRPGTSPWTAEAVMNPAAAVIAGRTHLVYRAIGVDGVSRLGYANSSDGIVFEKILPYPVYVAQKPRNLAGHARRYSPVMYPSGGSWGGCEDPRMVLIEGRVYVTFTMFDGWDFIRVAAISIAEEDFLAGQFWKWDGPHILSKPREVHKNWVLFPEKIHGKYAILHSISPNIEIAYRDSIEDIGTDEPFIESWVGSRENIPPRDTWDTYVRGAGAPPLRTAHGWLLFYHAIDRRDPGRYKLGAMILDFSDPTKVLYRSTAPVLAPDETYENRGKPGVVYVCGSVVRDGTLFVYYGGADKVVCVATTSFTEFVDALIAGNQPSMETVRKTQTP